MSLKPALSILEQIKLLRERGMTIDDQEITAKFLEDNNYYRLNIYFHKLMDRTDHYCLRTCFSKVIMKYSNDSWLRNKIMVLLEPIEVNARAHIAYYLGMTYGSDALYKEEIYQNKSMWVSTIDKLNKEIIRNANDPVIKHHNKNYGGYLPVWVALEYFSFKTLSIFFSNLQEKDKKAIARNYYHIHEDYFGQWLHVLSVLRNICAHYGYLYLRKFSLRPKIAKEFGWDGSKNYHLFACMLIIRYLTDKAKWLEFVHTINERTNTYQEFSLSDYGFPENWKSYLS